MISLKSFLKNISSSKTTAKESFRNSSQKQEEELMVEDLEMVVGGFPKELELETPPEYEGQI